MAEVNASHRARGASDVYTLLLVIAALALVVGIGYVWYRSTELFGGSPFSASAAATVDLLRSSVA